MCYKIVLMAEREDREKTGPYSHVTKMCLKGSLLSSFEADSVSKIHILTPW